MRIKANKKTIPNHLYGIPSEKKYPLDTLEHIILVINYFNKVPAKYKEELAINIYKTINYDLNILKDKEFVNKHCYDELIKYINNYKDLTRIRKIIKKEINTFILISDSSNIKYPDLYFNEIPTDCFITNNKDDIIERIKFLVRNKKKLPTNRCDRFLIYGYDCTIDEPCIFYLGDITVMIPLNSTDILFQTNIKIFNEINTFKIKKDMFVDNILLDELFNEKIKIERLNKKDNRVYYNRLKKFDKYKSLYIKLSPEEKLILNKRIKTSSKYINDNSYVVADLHFGKKDKSYDKEIIDKINSIVNKSDTLVFIGDIGYKYNLNVEYLTECIRSIKCDNKYLILGNHDLLSIEEYLNMGFNNIFESFIYKDIILSHYPRNQKEEYLNIHGDIHSSYYYPLYINSEKNKFNCFWNTVKRPLKIKEIMEIMNNK